MPEFRTFQEQHVMGKTCRERNRRTHWEWSHPWIEISLEKYYPEVVWTELVIHEMIHYYIMFNNMKDTSGHGTLFVNKMNEINRLTGLHVAVVYTGENASCQ